MKTIKIRYPVGGDVDVDLAGFVLSRRSFRHGKGGLSPLPNPDGMYDHPRLVSKSGIVFFYQKEISNRFISVKYNDEEVDGFVERSIDISSISTEAFLYVVASIYRPEERGHLMGHIPIECHVTHGNQSASIHLNEEFPNAMSVQLATVSYNDVNLIGLGSKTDLRHYVSLFNPGGQITH